MGERLVKLFLLYSSVQSHVMVDSRDAVSRVKRRTRMSAKNFRRPRVQGSRKGLQSGPAIHSAVQHGGLEDGAGYVVKMKLMLIFLET